METAMSFRFLCSNCGHEEENHDPNLVNEPAEGDLAWIEVTEEGYRMDVLSCMETEWSDEYKEKVADGYGRTSNCRYGYGYVSPNPEREMSLYHEDISRNIRGEQRSLLIVYDPRTGGSVIIPIE